MFFGSLPHCPFRKTMQNIVTLPENTLPKILKKRFSAVLLCLFFLSSLVLHSSAGAASSLENKYKKQKTDLNASLEITRQRISVLEKVEAPDPAQKNELMWLTQRAEFFNKHLTSIDRTLDFSRRSKEAPTQLTQTERELAAALPAPLKINKSLPLNELETQLDVLKKQLDDRKQARDDLDLEINRQNERQQSITENDITTRKRLDEINHLLISTYASTSSSPPDAQKELLLAEQAYLEQFIKELDQENLCYSESRELNRALKQQAERQVQIAENNFNNLDQVLNLLRSEAAAKVLQIAEAANVNTDNLHPLVKDLIIENQKLAEELTQISQARSSLSQERKQLNETLTSTKKRFDAIKQKITQIGLTDAIGLKLRNERKRLPNALEYTEKQKQRRTEINRVQLRRVEIEEKMMALTDARREALRLLNTYEPPIEEAEKDKLLDPIQNTLAQQKDKYLKELIGSYDIYFEKNLFPIMEDERSLISLVRDYRIYIDTHILWVQSAPSLELGNFKQVSSATLWLLNPSSLLRVFNNLKTDLSYNTFSFLLPLALIAALFPIERRLKPLVKQTPSALELQAQNELVSALQMLLVSLLKILPAPLFLAFLAWRLTQGPLPSIYGNAIASGLNALAVVLFMGLFLRKTCQDHQLGQSYLRWHSTTCQRINQHLRWFLPSASSFLFITMTTMDQPTQSHHDSLGRIAFMILMLLTGFFIRKINPSVTQEASADEATHRWLKKVQKSTLSLAFILPFVLLLGTANGYVYTCVQLAIYTFKTLSLVFIFNIVHDFALRALSLAFQRNKAAVDHAPVVQPATDGAENPPTQSDTDQNTLSEQATKTLTTIYWIAVFSGLTLIWSEVITALNLFNDIILWHSVSSADTAGANPIDTPVTLANLLMAIIILFLTFFISRNIAGLLEIVILQRLPFTASGRYAITSIARYTVTIVGLALTFNSIGIGWSKVQWLAAAITLGLGFGLQEIFANFVSGLIILFERPVRIGDAVTVGGISGKVTRIQMRATTITDWDRKELIIPNKEFVTGQVINWSLTDTVLRTLIPVGVAYGSDLELTYNTLLEIAKQHPSVLKDPEPSVRLVAFGESTLNFELRIFVPHPDLMLEVRHDLLMEIDRRFRMADIEIAFPQREVHVKSIHKDSIKQLLEMKKQQDAP